MIASAQSSNLGKLTASAYVLLKLEALDLAVLDDVEVLSDVSLLEDELVSLEINGLQSLGQLFLLLLIKLIYLLVL